MVIMSQMLCIMVIMSQTKAELAPCMGDVVSQRCCVVPGISKLKGLACAQSIEMWYAEDYCVMILRKSKSTPSMYAGFYKCLSHPK